MKEFNSLDLEAVKADIKAHEGDDDLRASFCEPLKAASKDLQAAAMFFMERGMKNPNDALAGSYDFMHLFGLVALGYMWGRIVKAADANAAAGTGDKAVWEAKRTLGRFYMERMLPETALRLARIKAGAETTMALPVEAF